MPVYCTYCHNCSGKHTAADCPEKGPRHKRPKSTLLKPTCWQCDSPDHVKRDCTYFKQRKTTRASTTSSETATSDMNVDNTVSADVPTTTQEVIGDDTEMDDFSMNDTSPRDNHNTPLASSQLSISIISTTNEDNANNDCPTLIAPEDQNMAKFSNEIQFVH